MKLYCPICYQNISHHQNIFDWWKVDPWICGDCHMWFKEVNQVYVMEKCQVRVLYEYTEELNSLLHQYKNGCDVALRSIFFHHYVSFIQKRYSGYTLVWMPSNELYVKQKGFDPKKEMLNEIKLDKMHVLELGYDDKLALCQDAARLLKKQKLLIVDDVLVDDKPIVDAYRLLKSNAKKVEALVLCGDTEKIKEYHP